MKTFFTDPTILWTIVTVALLLLAFYCILIFRPHKSIAVICEEEHLKISMKIEEAKMVAQLDLIHELIKRFNDRFSQHIPKARMDRLINDLCWNLRDKENELKRRG